MWQYPGIRYTGIPVLEALYATARMLPTKRIIIKLNNEKTTKIMHQKKYHPSILYFHTDSLRWMLLTGRPNRDCGKVFPPESVMVLSVVEVHVAKLRNVQVTKVELVKLIPGDVASPIRCRHSATQTPPS